MGFENQNTVCVYPGPAMKDPPFPMQRVNESEVADFVAKGWTTEAPKAEPAKAPEKTGDEGDDGDEKAPEKAPKKGKK